MEDLGLWLPRGPFMESFTAQGLEKAPEMTTAKQLKEGQWISNFMRPLKDFSPPQIIFFRGIFDFNPRGSIIDNFGPNN